MSQSEKKVVLITGGSQGIGAATARQLVAKGYFVVINYSSNSAVASKLVEELGAENAMSVQADAGNVSDIAGMVNTIVSKFGKIDAVIANAGRLGLQDLADTTEDSFDSLFQLNVKGPYFLAQKASPHMPPGSHLVLLSTTQCHASTVTPNYLLYTMTKGAIEQMGRVLAKGLGAKGIMVNTVAPGPTATELFLKDKPQRLLDTIAGFSPHKRFGQPEEVAEVIAFLTESKWVSGQVVKVNGGMA